MSKTRTFTRSQLDTLGLPHELASEDDAAEFPEAAVELHREQVDTRRWVSVHQLIFRAPDDGKAYAVQYVQGLTEMQDGIDPFEYEGATITATEMEQRTTTVQEWHPVEDAPEQPAEQPLAGETSLALVDGRDALAFVIIRPAGETADADRIAVEAGAHGMSKAATAYTLRHVADEFDKDATAEGDEPIPYKPTMPPLTSAERRFLTFALDRAADTMRTEDGFTDADEAALSKLRDLAEVEPPAADGWHVTRDHLDAFVRALVNEVDYDIHKGYECGEEDGKDHYPELVAEAATMLDAITGKTTE